MCLCAPIICIVARQNTSRAEWIESRSFSATSHHAPPKQLIDNETEGQIMVQRTRVQVAINIRHRDCRASAEDRGRRRRLRVPGDAKVLEAHLCIFCCWQAIAGYFCSGRSLQ